MATVYFYRSEKNADRQYLSNLSKTVIKNVFFKKYGEKLYDSDFKKTENGKPYITKQPDFHFSISHTENAVAVGFSQKPIGIDTEKIRNVNLKVADRFFTEEEKEYINSDTALSRHRFFEIWTKKEAVIKKAGLKLKDIKTATSEHISTFSKCGYIISVCTEKAEKIEFIDFDAENLETIFDL